MNTDYKSIVRKINCLSNELDAIYHKASRILGVSDSTMIVLYALYENGGSCPLYDIYGENGISKQTVNSAIRKLEAEGIVVSESDGGKKKRIYITDEGKKLVNSTVVPLLTAECNAFNEWSEEEFKQYITLNERYNEAFRKQIEKLEEHI